MSPEELREKHGELMQTAPEEDFDRMVQFAVDLVVMGAKIVASTPELIDTAWPADLPADYRQALIDTLGSDVFEARLRAVLE